MTCAEANALTTPGRNCVPGVTVINHKPPHAPAGRPCSWISATSILDAVLFENVYKCDGAESFRREGFSSQRKRDVQELPHHRADDDHPALAALRHRQALANRLLCGRVSVQSCLVSVNVGAVPSAVQTAAHIPSPRFASKNVRTVLSPVFSKYARPWR